VIYWIGIAFSKLINKPFLVRNIYYAFIATYILLVSCQPDFDEKSTITETWTISQMKATPVCTFSVGGLTPRAEVNNRIVIALLGLEDSVKSFSKLSLMNNGRFTIANNNLPIIQGTWETLQDSVLILKEPQHANVIELEIRQSNRDSMVLFLDRYVWMTQIYLTLKKESSD
jgi:hypothetical protein